MQIVRRPLASGAVGRRVSLAILVGATLLAGLFIAGCQSNSPASEPAGAAQAGLANRVDVVYFHRTQRCAACLWVGKMSRLTVETYFADELASGRVTFREVDVQKPENAALARLYRAAGSSLFLNYVKGGVDNIQQASDTYPYVGNQQRFTEALRAKIAAGLEASQ